MRDENMDLIQAVVIFLAAAVAVLGVTLAIVTVELSKATDENDVINKQLRQAADDNMDDIREIISLYDKNEELSSDNNRLASAVRELRAQNEMLKEANKELMNAEMVTPVKEKPPDISADTGVSWSVERLPQGLTNTFRCMDYRKITDKNSLQAILQEDEDTNTDSVTGIRYTVIGGEKYYHAALASAYGLGIGNAFRVTLDNGFVFNILHADFKHPISEANADDFGDKDKNYQQAQTTSVIEFVYDCKQAPQRVIDLGGMFIQPFTDGVINTTGNIVKIEYLGRRWKA